MNEDKLIELLNRLDDDLVEKEIDKLLEGVEVDMNSINKKAHEKLKNNNKKFKKNKVLPYVAAACVCLLSITTIYADDISAAIKSFMNKTPLHSTIVDGDAYYLKGRYALNNHITIESIMVSKGSLDMEISSDLSFNQLGEINIIPENDQKIVYYPGGYSEGENEYSFNFMNKTENNYNIKPFKDFQIIIAGNSYDVSLEKAKSLDLNSPIYISDDKEKKIKGVNVGAKAIDEKGKLNIQLITSFEDKDLKLSGLGRPIEAKYSEITENESKDSIISSGTGNRMDDIYVFDENNNKYKLEVPENAKGRPITTFETSAPKNKKLTLKLPAVIASYEKTMDSFSLNIPKEGEAALNREIDFNMQKAVVKSIKRISATSAQIEFELNTGKDKNISIRSFDFYSKDVKKINSKFDGDKAVVTLEFNKNADTANVEMSWPEFVINGDWVINMK